LQVAQAVAVDMAAVVAQAVILLLLLLLAPD
jgi:hypothetical protein